MKKKLLAAILALGMALSLAGCGNRQMIDLTYSYKYAIISLPNGEIIEGKVESWRDYEDGDQIQVTINGVAYLVHAADAVLMRRRGNYEHDHRMGYQTLYC